MPISAYVGSLGSGKSYEVVSSVIVPACSSGRRVVTNIYGINRDKIHEYCIKKSKSGKDTRLGDIVYVSNDDVKSENFFPYKDSLPEDTLCQYGDLIVVDESWRIWDSDKSICENHRSFIAEHRHFTNIETGVCCDLVVINQEVSSLPRFIKARLDTTFRMQKHIAIGMKSRYRVDVFNGSKLYKSNKITSYQRKYNPDIFPLYKSYENGDGKELTVDSRASILGKKSLYFVVVAMIFIFVFSVGYLYRFFNGAAVKTDVSDSPSHDSNLRSVNLVPDSQNIPKLSSTWRIVGKLEREGRSYVIITNNSGLVRMVPASTFNYQGVLLTGIVDGELVTFYSGGDK
ncbi:zonular occludens toxin family protein [Escherichia coli]|nr:hypothetical protein [Escherichia coli]EIP7782835.1 hypothetical protein [Escherichia coli]MBB7733507.1 hypothetical protein [Escherichia coli]MBB7733516.1 hypothetical protein [Escherichia coli]